MRETLINWPRRAGLNQGGPWGRSHGTGTIAWNVFNKFSGLGLGQDTEEEEEVWEDLDSEEEEKRKKLLEYLRAATGEDLEDPASEEEQKKRIN